MGTNSEARKRKAERDQRWSAIVLLDGEPVSGEVPCEDYEAALILSPLVAGWLGGPVSVAKAVMACRPQADEQASLFEVAQ